MKENSGKAPKIRIISLDFFVSELPPTGSTPPRLSFVANTLLVKGQCAVALWAILFSTFIRPFVVRIEFKRFVKSGEFVHIKN